MRAMRRNLARKGFTLIELMIVIAIVGVLAATVLVGIGKNADRDVRLEADRFSAFLRDVQNKALSTENVADASGKVCGFGVHYASGSELSAYYVQTSGSTPQDVDCGSVNKNYPGAANRVSAHYVGDGASIANFSDVFFLSPYGEVYSNNSLLGAGTIGFDFSKNGYTANDLVNLNGSGRVY